MAPLGVLGDKGVPYSMSQSLCCSGLMSDKQHSWMKICNAEVNKEMPIIPKFFVHVLE